MDAKYLNLHINVWTQPPYKYKNSLLFLIPKKPKHYQAILILEWIPVLSSTLNTTTEVRPLSKTPNPQLLPGRRSNMCVCVCVCVCVFTAVCVHLHGLNAEHKFRVWVTNSGHMSLHFTFSKFVYVWLRKSFYSRLLSERGTIQGRFC